MKKTSSMSKDSSNLGKPRFVCYCRSLVNFKNQIILFWNIWVIYGLWKSWRSIVFNSELTKNNSYVIRYPESLDSIPARTLWRHSGVFTVPDHIYLFFEQVNVIWDSNNIWMM